MVPENVRQQKTWASQTLPKNTHRLLLSHFLAPSLFLSGFFLSPGFLWQLRSRGKFDPAPSILFSSAVLDTVSFVYGQLCATGGINILIWRDTNLIVHCHFIFHLSPLSQKPCQLSSSSPLLLFPNNVTRLAGQPIIPLALSDAIQGEITSGLAILLPIKKRGSNEVSTSVQELFSEQTERPRLIIAILFSSMFDLRSCYQMCW